MDSSKLILTGKTTAFISFIGGTFILMLFYFTCSEVIGRWGLRYTAIAGSINLIILGMLAYQAYRDKSNRAKIFKICGLMSLNIPIVLFYCWFALVLLDTMRITFINTTTAQLNDIKIYGCEEKHIQQLLPRQSRTVWISIPGDCAISIEYFINGQTKTEDVSGYTSKGSGKIMTYKIGTNQPGS